MSEFQHPLALLTTIEKADVEEIINILPEDLKKTFTGLLGEGLRRVRDEPLRYFSPLAKQKDFILSDIKDKWAFGGNRSGKTVLGAVYIACRALGKDKIRKYNEQLYQLIKHKDWDEPPVRIWIVSPDFPTAWDVTIPEVKKWIPEEEIASWHETKRLMILKNGTTIGFKSCDSGRKKFQGVSRHVIWFDEEPDYQVYDECMMRLIDTAGECLGTMTPVEGITWIFDEIYEQRHDTENLYVTHLKMRDNIHLSEDEINRKTRNLTDEQRAVREEGQFIQMAGLIWKSFNEKIHIIEPMDPLKINPERYTFYEAIDPGKVNPTGYILAAVDRENNVIILDETYERGLTAQAQRDLILKKREKWGVKKVKATIIDNQSKEPDQITSENIYNYYNRNGIPCIFANKNVRAGIELVDQYFTPDNGMPSIYIQRNCKHTKKELRSYRWLDYDISSRKDKNFREQPLKSKDHLCDCIRYLVMHRPRWIDPNRVKHIKRVRVPGTGY